METKLQRIKYKTKKTRVGTYYIATINGSDIYKTDVKDFVVNFE